MKTTIRHILSAGAVLFVLLSACSREEDGTDMPQNGGYLQIKGEIVGAGVADTRINKLGNLPSYASFSEGNKIGFFSFHGPDCKLDKTENAHGRKYCDGNLENEPLTYTNINGSYRFTSDKIKNVILNLLGLTFAYYPYTEYNEDGLSKNGPEGYQTHVNLGDNDFYLDIFSRDDNGDEVAFEDFLTVTKKQYDNVNYEFQHHFSMLLLYLGEGFNPDDNEKLTVHLTEKVLGAHVTRKWSGGFDSFVVTVDKVSKEQNTNNLGHSKFTAEKINGYRLPGKDEEKTVYPIILPPGVEIDYIEVEDISGILQKVKPTKEALPELAGGMMYPVTIKMTGITPVIYPHEIIDWNDNGTIEITKQTGIYNVEEFKEWLSVYNDHVDNLSSASSVLENYGDWNAENGWTFYLRDNIDCSGIVATDGALIKELPANVTLEGGNYVLSNLMLDFENETPTDNRIGLIGEINGGTLQGLRVEFATVRNMNKDIPTGCIAATISSGKVEGCTVRQVFMTCRGVEQAGVLAGKITDGSVNNCKFQGTVIADVNENEKYPMYKGVVGVIESGWLAEDVVNRLILAE